MEHRHVGERPGSVLEVGGPSWSAGGALLLRAADADIGVEKLVVY